MGFFYFDESVPPNSKFVLGAFAYSEVYLEIERAFGKEHSSIRCLV